MHRAGRPMDSICCRHPSAVSDISALNQRPPHLRGACTELCIKEIRSREVHLRIIALSASGFCRIRHACLASRDKLNSSMSRNPRPPEYFGEHITSLETELGFLLPWFNSCFSSSDLIGVNALEGNPMFDSIKGAVLGWPASEKPTDVPTYITKKAFKDTPNGRTFERQGMAVQGY